MVTKSTKPLGNSFAHEVTPLVDPHADEEERREQGEEYGVLLVRRQEAVRDGRRTRGNLDGLVNAALRMNRDGFAVHERLPTSHHELGPHERGPTARTVHGRF